MLSVEYIYIIHHDFDGLVICLTNKSVDFSECTMSF